MRHLFRVDLASHLPPPSHAMENQRPTAVATPGPALIRGVAFLLLWFVLIGPGLSDLVPGFLAAALATWASLRLLPPSKGRLRWIPLAGFLVRFLWQSVVAGADVAFRVFHPRLPMAPGFVEVSLDLPAGTRRNAFLAVSSLMPGTLPAGMDREGRLIVHCLDSTMPVAKQMRSDEARLSGLWTEGGDV